MIIKKKNIRTIVITCALLGIIIFSIHSYNVYMSRQIYNEGTSNVKASYSQVNQTFNMFAQRNWNVLSDWNVYLTKILNNDSGLQWNDFVREKEKWHYSDFYLFNEKNQFITIEGRSGVADNAKDAFNELFKANEPVISSYISTKGVRKVLFAYPSDGITVDGISYTGLAVSYDNTDVESLVNGKSIEVNFDEQIVFNRLEKDESAIWSLLLASGYLKVDSIVHKGITLEPWYRLSITNLETISMFSNLFKGWFADVSSNYNEFVKALFSGDVKAMNVYMNDVAMSTFSSFDTGNHPSDRSQPERFYHGLVLGLLVDIRDNYEVLSNRESGFGRYDVVLVPREKGRDAFVMEFKVFDDSEESGLEDTVAAALRQIDEKNYDTQLLDRGISENNIKHYGFAFCGKKVLIGG